jgi:hypothetical protein
MDFETNARMNEQLTRDNKRRQAILMTLMFVSLVIVVWSSFRFHETCDNGWGVAILKALGVSLLSSLLYTSVQQPMVWYERNTTGKRKLTGETVPGKIAKFMKDETVMALTNDLLTVALVLFFTKECSESA